MVVKHDLGERSIIKNPVSNDFFSTRGKGFVCLQLQYVWFFSRVGTMAVDWIGFAYASLLVVGGVVAYTRKG